ncbi:MAG: hypothetical protein E7028_04750 [Planctomycetaceae bacterium]|nr:hypothetical protein [Planctomycetaceae bacterium]
MNKACVVFLIEEAPSMRMRIAEGTHSKLESISTAINSAIRQMDGLPPMDVAVIGYHRNLSGEPELGSRFGGKFTGKVWVSSDDLIANPLRIESRTRKSMDPATRLVTPVQVDFPVWFETECGPGKLEHIHVFRYLAEMLQEWAEAAQPILPPLVFSFLADLQPGNSIANAVVPLGSVSTPQGFPVLFQFHAGTYANVPAIKYPSVPQFLPYGPVQELFFACSPLSEPMFSALRQNQEFPSHGAKGLVHNGRMIDIVRMLSILKTIQTQLGTLTPESSEKAQGTPEAMPEKTQAAEKMAMPENAFPPAFSPTRSPELSTEKTKTPQMASPFPSPLPAARTEHSLSSSIERAVPLNLNVPHSSESAAISQSLAEKNVSEMPENSPSAEIGPAQETSDAGEADPQSVQRSIQTDSQGTSEIPADDSARSPFPLQTRLDRDFTEDSSFDDVPRITPLPPRIPKEPLPAESTKIQLPNLLTGEINSIFDDFDRAEDEDDSLADIPSVENLPEVKSEIVPHGFKYCCDALPDNKIIGEPETGIPRQSLLVLLVDRSVSDLMYRPAHEIWNRRLEKTRFMLGEISRRGRGRYDVALVFYGKEQDGSMSVVSDTLGSSFICDKYLAGAAGRVEPMMVHIPNGIGGLLSLPRKKLSFTECSPTYPANPTPGFERAVEIIQEWYAVSSRKILPPVLLHITSGQFQIEHFDDALGKMNQVDMPICFQQWIFTERPHPGICCPNDEMFTTDQTLLALWERTDALPAREFLAGVRPGIHEESRGMVVNMDFDVLFEVLDTMAQKMPQS